MKNLIFSSLFILILGGLVVSQKSQSKTPVKRANAPAIFALSYNVCFNAMTHNGNTGSAAELGQKCVWDKNNPMHITICAENIANMIDDLPGTYNVPSIDFVGLQEASNWKVLQSAAGNTLSKMAAIHTHQGREDAVTFYDSNKYHVEHTWSDDLGHGRPFQITIFKEGIIFLNIHNGHGSQATLDYITERLSGKLMAKLTKTQINALKTYRIIAGGDFNQVALGETHVSFTPFKYAGIPTRVSLSNPPSTCCDTQGNLPWVGYKNGDFIFDSQSAAQPEVPKNYDKNELQSDHLPVVAKL